MTDARNVLSNHKNKIAAVGVTIAAALAFALPATISAAPLDKTDLTVTSSSQGEDGESASGTLRVVTADQLENVGIGLGGAVADEDGNQGSGKLVLESTDYLEDLSALSDVKAVGEDGEMFHNTNKLQSTDHFENVDGSSWTWSNDDEGNGSSLGLTGHSHDYGEAAGVAAESTVTNDGNTNANEIKFGFED